MPPQTIAGTQAAHARPAAAARVAAVALLSIALSYGFSRLTGRIHGAMAVPVGVPALTTAALLTAWSPRRYGWQWGTTGQSWRLIAAWAAVVVAVVAGFRLAAGVVPYAASFAEIILVPLGEEGLFRGFLLITVLHVLRADLSDRSATWGAVAISAVAFGVGHLGNLGFAPTPFVLVQAAAATAFGLVAGWVRVRTDSLAGPVLLHAAMNAAAVL